MPKIQIDEQLKAKILEGRKAVDAYRDAHTQLYSKPRHKGVPKEHTPLLNKMLDSLKRQGFNSLQEFSQASIELCILDTGIYDHNVHKFRKDLEILGNPSKKEGVELKQSEDDKELVIDGQIVMSTSIIYHLSMKKAIDKCPRNARCFVAGLGLGLILLYLAESGKTTEVIICEIDRRVLDLLSPRIKEWIADHYPEFSFQIVHADAFKKVLDFGKFDWIFFHTNLTELEPSFEETAKNALTTTGIYTCWQFCKVEVTKW